MQRREFLTTSGAAALGATTLSRPLGAAAPQPAQDPACCGPGYASPAAATKAPPEKLLYVTALYLDTGIDAPDYLATVDVDPQS
ncbi:MAG: twin-arginine translocation signal domain-containing protein, partial [Planctomycetaceae bacterium]|nr:twin-arginine translocation signal domain-containing protein [Planctomycetaceae bacterium]